MATTFSNCGALFMKQIRFEVSAKNSHQIASICSRLVFDFSKLMKLSVAVMTEIFTQENLTIFGDSDKVKFKPACSATETSQKIKILLEASLSLILFK